MNYAIQHISRMIDDAENIGGMRVGMPKAHVDTSLLRHVIIHYERLEAENTALKARVEELESRSAGVWVPVTEQLPPELWEGAVIEEHLHHEEKRFVYRVHMDTLLVRDGIAEWKQSREVTHWLDVKLPGGK